MFTVCIPRGIPLPVPASANRGTESGTCHISMPSHEAGKQRNRDLMMLVNSSLCNPTAVPSLWNRMHTPQQLPSGTPGTTWKNSL